MASITADPTSVQPYDVRPLTWEEVKSAWDAAIGNLRVCVTFSAAKAACRAARDKFIYLGTQLGSSSVSDEILDPAREARAEFEEAAALISAFPCDTLEAVQQIEFARFHENISLRARLIAQRLDEGREAFLRSLRKQAAARRLAA
ncbi:MAG TPA: hypothetical protein DIT64_12275 [Verrucomicrobiales bacterium]|nr:hypothetical protein [Verrucomicrobiales bacterium]